MNATISPAKKPKMKRFEILKQVELIRDNFMEYALKGSDGFFSLTEGEFNRIANDLLFLINKMETK
jgi:hypothetical protein